jgi:hypothetical protein
MVQDDEIRQARLDEGEHLAESLAISDRRLGAQGIDQASS